MMQKEETDRVKSKRTTDEKSPVAQSNNVKKADAAEYKRANQSNADEKIAQADKRKNDDG